MVICEEALMSGMGFKLLLHAVLIPENLTVSLVLIGFKLAVVPIARIASVEIEKSNIRNKIIIRYQNQKDYFRVITLLTSKADIWKYAFESLQVRVITQL